MASGGPMLSSPYKIVPEDDGVRSATPLSRQATFTTVQPLSFDRSSFSNDPFSAAGFLLDRRHIPLDRLKSELQQALKDLKAELVELINLDYGDFIELSGKLVGVDARIEALRGPVAGIISEVESVRNTLLATIAQLEAELDQRASIRERKGYLQLLVGIYDSIQKLDRLLNLADDDTTSPTLGEQDPYGDPGPKRIDRIANEYTQLLYLLSRTSHTNPFVSQLQPQIKRIKQTLSNNLSASLSSSYLDVMKANRESAETGLAQILRTYVSIDRVQEAESTFIEWVTMPFLEKVITRQVLTDTQSARSSDSPLRIMYDQILAFVTVDCNRVLQVAGRVFQGTSGNLLVNAIWAPITTTIIKKVPFIFNAGIPEVFHVNYTTTSSFVSSFEETCRTRKTLMALRSHPSTIEFMKRWQLPVYFQIRFREIASDFEEACSASISFDEDIRMDNGIVLSPTTALMVCVQLCWDDAVYLSGLEWRFWKLTLQLIARYAQWVQALLPPEGDPNQASAVTIPTSATVARQVPPIPANGAAKLRKMLYFYNDVVVATKQLMAIFNESILPKAVGADTQKLQASLEESFQPLQNQVPWIQNWIVQHLVGLCIEPLGEVQNIPRQYRMTNKEAPARPSYYVAEILKPLHQTSDGFAEIFRSTAHARLEMSQCVVDGVANQFCTTLQYLLDNVRKFEEFSRKKVKRMTNGLSDDDKIRMQIWHDVQGFLQQAKAAGADDNTGACATLRALVEPLQSANPGIVA
ncbi:oligomeric golgi complex component, COG2-domain-containing protein [Gaertneriomyces semiglobifer]|nr:oligomeric golgi complex component, COG2-domain-containing protein [Gaertneriomyces semiglobifer]